ncbi:DUF2894 domain-containing protein [Trinickia violacea]|uniref:DUF2894 domain-containing protein n=1 Tax=Trinickia violacea TaxID=2571746 RepID=A0A4P8ILI8_9BURK|nr:DUF2894 domain-containing protein [Trinickia violacea]QCP49772.1 DUF2894 domain-containing protein [Trinickia violacea]
MADTVNNGGASARATLDAWRERGADRLDPVRFRFIDALERRSAAHSGAARRMLDEKLSALLDAYAGDLECAASNAGDGLNAASSRETALGTGKGLKDLVESIAASRASEEGGLSAGNNAGPTPRSYPELAMLDEFREIWSKVSTDRQLRQSEYQVPKNAGPLNSSSLVHRSLSLMRELSPGYLRQFLAYADALSWLEQMTAVAAPPAKEAPRAASAKKSARSKPR